jgi:hypothetical protein
MAGSLVRTTATFASITGLAADPTTVTLKYKTGAGTTTTVTYPSAPIVRDSTGVYHADLDTTGWAGPDDLLYATEWTGTGTVQAIGAGYFQVTPAAL